MNYLFLETKKIPNVSEFLHLHSGRELARGTTRIESIRFPLLHLTRVTHEPTTISTRELQSVP